MRSPERSAFRRRSGPVAVAVGVSLIWLGGAAVLLVALGGDGARWLAIAVTVALPLVVIWFAALVARQSEIIHEEAERLRRAAEEMRGAAAAARERREPHPQAAPRSLHPAAPPSQPRPMRLRQVREQGPAMAGPPVAPPTEVPAEAGNRQGALPLEVAADEKPVSLSTLIRALDFPASEEDKDGFRALHAALRDPRARRLVQASQDVLTLLSEEDIYMDDLPPTRARPELWRRFATGERGPEVGKIGGIRDRSSLALTAARLRADPVFRDAAHHFLRLFDNSLSDIAPEATDAQLAALADTRTARAFMLVGRAAGMFE